MGTELARRGVDPGRPGSSAAAVVEAAEGVRAVHLDHVRAGCDVVRTNTFRAHAGALSGTTLHPEAVARAATGLARAAATGAGRPVRVMGCLGPFERLGPGPADVEAHRTLARHLVDSGCDGLVFETLRSQAEVHAAVAAATGLAVPLWISVACRDPVHSLAGDDLLALRSSLRNTPVELFALNCTAVDVVAAALPRLDSQPREDLPELGAYPHAGLDPASRPMDLVERVWALTADADLQLLGVCCGGRPRDVAALRQRVDAARD